MGERKKIMESELIVGIAFLFGLYILTDMLDGVAIGIFVVPIINWFCTGATWLFFKLKNDPYANKLGANITMLFADTIPFLPATVFSFIVKAAVHNHPELLGAVSKAIGVATKL